MSLCSHTTGKINTARSISLDCPATLAGSFGSTSTIPLEDVSTIDQLGIFALQLSFIFIFLGNYYI